jgi:molybdate transport system regulatory protein
MRNQLPCRVLGISRHQGAVEVRLQTTGGALLQARITRDSAQLLGLEAGKNVLALCKAMAVDVAAVSAHTSRSLNALHGQVSRISKAGQAMSEVTLVLPGGGSWVGMAGMGSIDAQPLRVGDSAVACFDASAVVLGVEA